MFESGVECQIEVLCPHVQHDCPIEVLYPHVQHECPIEVLSARPTWQQD